MANEKITIPYYHSPKVTIFIHSWGGEISKRDDHHFT
jgi:hypothetical protein